MTISDVAASAAPVSDVAAVRGAHRPYPPLRDDARRRFFAVEYAINPWMDTSTPVDAHLAMNQWESLRQTYKELGHTVELVEPVAGLPDMVYAANGGLLVNGKAVVARFAYPQRAGESAAYAEWMDRHGYHPAETRHVNEGQGDLLVVGLNRVGGLRISHRPPGTRRDRRGGRDAALSASNWSTRASITSTPRWRCSTTPPSPTTRRRSARSRARGCSTLFPDAIEVATADAYVLGLNAVSDGLHVVHPAAATGFAGQLSDAGFVPIGVDLSELLKGGGSIKCCTLEVYS